MSNTSTSITSTAINKQLSKNVSSSKPTMAQFLSGQQPIKKSIEPALDHARILTDLLKLLVSPKVTSAELITYMEKYPISPDTYLLSFQKDVQLPLIYYCCSHSNLQEFFNYLITKNVNVMAEMVCDQDPTKQIELLYYSQTEYIPTLINRGCHLRPERIVDSGEKLLIRGNISKLMTLYKHGVMTKSNLLQITQQPLLMFKVLDHLYERFFYLCRETPNHTQLQPLLDELVRNYINVFKLFLKNGVSVNQMQGDETFLQRILNTYIFDLIKLVSEYHPNFESIEFLHYSNFELTSRQIMKSVYNDENYAKIQEFLKDKIIPEKINVKKVMTRKKITNKLDSV